MKESIFRKESLDQVNSPEDLNSYIRVATPGVWLILAAIVLLLTAFIIFACYTEVDGTRLISFVMN